MSGSDAELVELGRLNSAHPYSICVCASKLEAIPSISVAITIKISLISGYHNLWETGRTVLILVMCTYMTLYDLYRKRNFKTAHGTRLDLSFATATGALENEPFVVSVAVLHSLSHIRPHDLTMQ